MVNVEGYTLNEPAIERGVISETEGPDNKGQRTRVDDYLVCTGLPRGEGGPEHSV